MTATTTRLPAAKPTDAAPPVIPDGARIVELRVDNFKRLGAVAIRPDGSIVSIVGRNDQGKTTLLDAIAVALGGKDMAPTREPIKKGAAEAIIAVELTGGLKVRRRFWKRGPGDIVSELRIESDGTVVRSPQAVLDKALGALTFNPLTFASIKPRDQFEMLKALVTGFDFDANARLRNVAFDERTAVNRRAAEAAAAAARIHVPAGPKPAPVDQDAIAHALGRAATHNGEIEARRSRRAAAEAELERLEATIEELQAKATSLRGRLDAVEALPAAVDVEALRAQLHSATSTNEIIRAFDTRDLHLASAAELNAQAANLSAEIVRLDKEKRDAITGAKMPVPGLDFGDDEIILNELPFSQASGRDKLATSVAVGMALNPTLRVMLIDEASSLDVDGLKLIADMAAAADFQVWMVRVAGDGATGIIIDDGHVAP